MSTDALNYHGRPKLCGATMVMGLSGWMDGGEVSTGTIDCLVTRVGGKAFAEIDPEGFYIYNFPGTMEVSALFRPYGKIENGLVRAFEPPSNRFHYADDLNLVLFKGREPNLNWRTFAKCLFAVVADVGISRIYFVGSVAGLVPHTRAPRLSGVVSDESLQPLLEKRGIRPTNYEGPVSLVTYLMTQAEERGIEMATLVAEIPAYVEGTNSKCVESMTRTLCALLKINVDLDDLSQGTDELEQKLNEAVEKRPELAKHIHKLEEDYDNEVFDTNMGDLKDWLEQQGIRLD